MSNLVNSEFRLRPKIVKSWVLVLGWGHWITLLHTQGKFRLDAFLMLSRRYQWQKWLADDGIAGCKRWVSLCCFVAAMHFMPEDVQARSRHMANGNSLNHSKSWKEWCLTVSLTVHVFVCSLQFSLPAIIHHHPSPCHDQHQLVSIGNVVLIFYVIDQQPSTSPSQVWTPPHRVWTSFWLKSMQPSNLALMEGRCMQTCRRVCDIVHCRWSWGMSRVSQADQVKQATKALGKHMTYMYELVWTFELWTKLYDM